MNLREVVELVDEAEQLVDIFTALIPVIQKAGIEAEPLLTSLVDYKVELTCRAFDKYITHGFSREEALNIILSNKENLQKALHSIQNAS